MKKADICFFFFLIFLAAFIWLRDASWITSSDEAVPLLVVLPLVFYLGRPWKVIESNKFLALLPFFGALLLFFFGVLSDLTVSLAASFALFLYSWQKVHLEEETLNRARPLLILTLFAFPWVTLDIPALGWWFRLSGAYVTTQFFQLLGYEVVQNGTNIQIGGFEIFIENACSGLNTLQSMLLAGTTLACFTFDTAKKVLFQIPFLFFAAWFANTLRIILTTALALLISIGFVQGDFHIFVGWLTIIFVFLLSYLFFQWEKEHSLFQPLLLFKIALLAYTGYAARELLVAWQTSAFDRQGWAPLAIWVLPCFFKGESTFSSSCALIAIFFTTLGIVGEFNTFAYIGLALAIGATCRNFRIRSFYSFFWLISAISWMPTLGYVLKDLGPDPVFYIRIVLATFGTLVVLL
jgi:exosortase/archaeosortase family protein